jgi:chromosomal replication initiation ATPase DnaA
MRDDRLAGSTVARRQLALPFLHRPRYAALDFLAAPSNEEARAWLDRTAAWPDGRLVLWGPPGCGKTHLLHVWCEAAGATLISAAAESSDPLAAARVGALAVDDADRPRDEAALLHALNVAASSGSPVLLAARGPPAAWSLGLDDLASRVRAALAVAIGRAEESLLAALLARLLAEHQLVVAPAVQGWLLNRLPRSPAAMCETVARLDAATMEAGRGVSRELASVALAGMLDDGDQAEGAETRRSDRFP